MMELLFVFCFLRGFELHKINLILIAGTSCLVVHSFSSSYYKCFCIYPFPVYMCILNFLCIMYLVFYSHLKVHIDIVFALIVYFYLLETIRNFPEFLQTVSCACACVVHNKVANLSVKGLKSWHVM